MGQALLLPSSTELMAEILELLKIEQAWEEKYEALRELSENFSMREQMWENKLQQLEDDNKDLKDKLDLAEKEKKQQAELLCQLEQQIQQRDAEVLDLNKQKTSLSQRLGETRKMLLDKRDALVDCEENWDLKYRKQSVDFYKVMGEKNQFYMAKIKQLLDDKKDLQDKFNKDLEESSMSWASTVMEMYEEKTLLEDICLDMKKKMRGFFSCSKSMDRETMLEKMKSKMLKSRMVKEMVEQEAEVEQTKEPEKKKCFLYCMFRKKKSDCDSQVEECHSGWITVNPSSSTLPPPSRPSSSTSPPSLGFPPTPSSSRSPPFLHPHLYPHLPQVLV